MNILAIDYGTNKSGLAWVNTDLGVVLPYGLILKDGNPVPKKLLEIIKTDNPEKIVLGMPYSAQDSSLETTNMVRVRAFGEALAAATSIKIDYMDERFTSQQADNTPGDVSRDEKSAMIILESYIATDYR